MPKLVSLISICMLAVVGQPTLTTAQIAQRVSPSVVVIQGKTNSGSIVGSGFILSKDGKIVTNLHVIKDLKSATVQLSGGEVFDSITVLGTDERRDLAIVRIAGFDLPPLALGNSNAVSVGEPVVIVGSPRGLEGTVTAGILSSVRDSGDGFKVLQTDAAVNPGNSGGPLVNGKGQAIGVVSFKFRSSEGLNFALPVNYVSGLLNELHEPMSLDQMRTTLSVDLPVEPQDKGVSLKETLDWLKEKIPLAANHYVLTFPPGFDLFGDGSKDVRHTTVPIRFESCTIVFDSTETNLWEKYPTTPDVNTTRYTVPLGEFGDGRVFQGGPSVQGKSGRIDFWIVGIETKSKVILEESYQSVGNIKKTESRDSAILIFYEESIANRVLLALRHAAELCRGKEPF